MIGIELIAKERQEQIDKHKWNDTIHNKGELIEAALFSIDPMKFDWPEDWSYEHMLKIKEKAYINRLAVAGALIAAEIDRIMSIETNENLPK